MVSTRVTKLYFAHGDNREEFYVSLTFLFVLGEIEVVYSMVFRLEVLSKQCDLPLVISPPFKLVLSV